MLPLEERLADNPFPGLRAFRTHEADVFFGRQRQIDDLLALLDRVPLIAVSGSSGCGKSSLVLAGLLRALELRAQEDADGAVWHAVKLHPGDSPIDNLARPLAEVVIPAQAGDPARVASLAGRLRLGAAALAEAVSGARLPRSHRVLVVVDQFEELFRYRRMADADESAAFVKLLVHAAENPTSPVSVILTLRSDTLGDCADYRDLPEAVSRGLFLVPRLTREQRKQAIVGPVERRGFAIAPRLVQRVLNDVSDTFDDLPVMQHALSRTWQHWSRETRGERTIDSADYAAIGGAAKALELHADQAYESLGRELGGVAERIFRALTERISGPGSEVRRPLPFKALCQIVDADELQVATVVDRYRRADTSFLLPSEDKPRDSDPVDISHESLIRGWPRLRAWTEQEAQSAQMYRRLVTAAELYVDDDDLLRGAALQFAAEWRERERPNPHWAALYRGDFARAMVFLEASRAARAQEQAAAARRTARRVALGVAISVGCLIAAAVMGWLWDRSVDAREQLARQKLDVEKQSASRRLALDAVARQNEGRRDAALLLAAAALQVRPHAEEAQEIMRALLLDAPLRYVARHRAPVSAIAFSPDGQRFASASRDGIVQLWDLKADAALPDARSAADDQADIAMGFDAQGAVVASPDASGRVLAAGRVGAMVTADAVERGANLVQALDPATALFASSDGGAEVRMWNLVDGRLLGVLRAEGSDIVQLVLAPGGRTLAAVLANGSTLLWDAPATSSARRARRLATSEVSAIAFSPDGRSMVTASRDGAATARGEVGLLLWDVARGQVQRRLPILGAKAEVLLFSPDGQTLAAGLEDGWLMLWDVASPVARARTLEAHKTQVSALAFAADGRTLASGGADRTILVWDVASAETTRRYARAHDGRIEQLAFAPDGATLASSGRDQTVVFWDVARAPVRHGAYTPRLDAVAAIAFSPSGQQLAMASEDSFVWLWDVAAGRLPADPLGRASILAGEPEGELTSVAFSPDGRFVAAGGEDHKVRLWSAASGETIGSPLEAHAGRVGALAFTPDGKTLATGGRDKAVILWSIERRQPQPLPIPHTDEVTAVAFSPDGKLLATASRDRTLRLWDLSRRAARVVLTAEHEFTSVAFSPDGALLAAASFDGRVRFWRTADGTQAGDDIVHGNVTSIAFGAGGVLATGGGDATVRLWSVDTRQPLGEPLVGHAEPVLGVAFRSDGKTLASTSSDRQVILWDVDLSNWPQRACRIANRDVTDNDWPRGLRGTYPQRAVCAR